MGLTRRQELALLSLIVIAALGLRLWRLDSVPPGYTHDEAGHGHDARAILEGARPIYQRVGYGREPLYDYLAAGLMGLDGRTGIVLRLASVLFGIGTLVATYAWVRSAFDAPTALVAIAFQAVSFWPVATSRQGLRSSLLPVLFGAAVYLFWRLYRSPPRTRPWLAAGVGLLLGATLYTYPPARLLWFAFVLFLFYLALVHRGRFRLLWRPTLAALLLAGVLATPLFVYLRAHPEAEPRLGMLSEPLDALGRGDVSLLWRNVQSALKGLVLPGEGDEFLAYNLPGRPMLDPVTGVLFAAGVGLCLIRWREAPGVLALLWLVLGMAPALVTGAMASTTRGIGALAVVFLFPALSAVYGARRARSQWGVWGGRAVGVGIVALTLITGLVTVRDYFEDWGQAPPVRAAYQHTVVEMAAYLGEHKDDATTGVSTLHPGAPHDPYVLETALGRRLAELRWFDGRRALVVPSDGPASLLAPSSAPLDSYFAALPGLVLQERIQLRPDDLDPFFLVYDWDPVGTRAELQRRAAGQPQEQQLPVNLGDALQLTGYDLRTPTVSRGGEVEIVTLWQVMDPDRLNGPEHAGAGVELVLFTHAVDGEGAVAGQEDRLDAPDWCWHTGDLIAQIHRFRLDPAITTGALLLEVGAYRRDDVMRLPVIVGGNMVGDRVLLPGPEVVGP
jgi:4-amino-4-deoxy-L-arabinose transferase-like glycosyltransferase